MYRLERLLKLAEECNAMVDKYGIHKFIEDEIEYTVKINRNINYEFYIIIRWKKEGKRQGVMLPLKLIKDIYHWTTME